MNDDTIDEARLRKLREEVAALPRSIEPPADAWTHIRSAIEADRNPDIGFPTVEGRLPARGSAPGDSCRAGCGGNVLLSLAAAALFLVAGSSALTAIAINDLRIERPGRSQRYAGEEF